MLTLYWEPGEPMVTHLYSRSIYPPITSLLSTLSGLVPVSLTEISVLLLLGAGAWGFARCWRRKWRWRQFLAAATGIFSLVYFAFYISWGFNYWRQPLAVTLGASPVKIDSLRFRHTLEALLEQANNAYRRVDAIDPGQLDRDLERGLKAATAVLALSMPGGNRRPKTLFFNIVLDKTLTNGFFSPIFHEIHLNKSLLPVEYAYTLAHEKCHQLGIAREAEASFVGYLACLYSGNPIAQYSATMDVLWEFLVRGRRMLSDYQEIRRRLAPGILADYEKIRARVLQHAGAVSDVSRKAYDQYLKANRIEEGVQNYRGVVELLILWYARKDSL